MYNAGACNLYGGTITNNGTGGGVYNNGTLTVGGTATVTGNSPNVYLAGGTTITLNSELDEAPASASRRKSRVTLPIRRTSPWSKAVRQP